MHWITCDNIPIILNAGLPCDAGPFGAAPAEEALPALAFDAVELAPAALSAADVLDWSAMISIPYSYASRIKLPQ